MFQAVITLVLNSTLYFRKTELAYVPSDGGLIDVHGQGVIPLVLEVTQVRNRIGKTESGLAVRAYQLAGDKIKLPKTDGDSRPSLGMLKQMDEILKVYGFERIPDGVAPAPQRSVSATKEDPLDLRVVFTKHCSVQWLAMNTKDPTAIVSAGVPGAPLGGLHAIGPCDDRDDCWLITSQTIAGSTPMCAFVLKDTVQIPPSRSVAVTFLEGLELNWTLPDGREMGDHFDKGSTRRFKAVLANPLNPDQVAFVEQDNGFTLLPSNCFKHIRLPAGDLTNLPMAPKKAASKVGDDGPIAFHVVGEQKPMRIPHIYGWIRFKRVYNAETQLSDDTVRRRFEEGECVMVRTLKDDDGDILELRLVDGHLWRIPRQLLEKCEHVLWIQMRVAKKLILRCGIDERVIDVVAGERLLVRNMTLTGIEADVPHNRDVRTFVTGIGQTTFTLRDHEYRIGEVALKSNGHDPGEVNPGLTNIFFKLPEITVDVATATRHIPNVKIPKGEYLARLVEVEPHRVTITMPDFSYFAVDRNVCTLIGGHAIDDPCNNAPYRNAVAFAQR